MTWKQPTTVAAILVGVPVAVLAVGRIPAPVAGALLGGVALATAGLLAWDLVRAAPRARDLGLLALTATALWLWLTPWGLTLGGHLHRWDFFHHYVGGKYFRELGHGALYECTLVADARAGVPVPASVWVRDLRSNRLVPARSLLKSPERCTERFSPERWASFERDVAWFRAQMSPQRWQQLRTDHGYNAPPTWGLLGIPLANLAPASRTSVGLLMLLDPVLLALMFASVAWAFGWRAMCVAVVFWTAYQPADWSWAGGSLLRHDWLAASVIGTCALRRDRPLLAGWLLASAAWLRLFPAVLFAGPALQVVGDTWRDRRLRIEPATRRLLLGALAASVLLPALATPIAGGPGAWADFAHNTRLHAGTPLENHMGLRALLSYDPARRVQATLDRRLPDPYQPWREARHETFASRVLVYLTLAGGFLALLAAAVQRQPAWVAVALSSGLAAVAVDLTCYYYALLVVVCLAWSRWPPVGIVLLVLAAASRAVPALVGPRDEVFFWTSLLTLGALVFATAYVGWGRAGSDAPQSAWPGRQAPGDAP